MTVAQDANKCTVFLLPLDEFEKANWRNEGAEDKEVWSLAFCEQVWGECRLRLLVTNLIFIPAEITGYGLEVHMQFENMPVETRVLTSNKVLQLHEGLELNYALLQR